MKYQADHILKLRYMLIARNAQLLSILYTSLGADTVMINASDIRLAVDDFKVILTEIRRLK